MRTILLLQLLITQLSISLVHQVPDKLTKMKTAIPTEVSPTAKTSQKPPLKAVQFFNPRIGFAKTKKKAKATKKIAKKRIFSTTERTPKEIRVATRVPFPRHNYESNVNKYVEIIETRGPFAPLGEDVNQNASKINIVTRSYSDNLIYRVRSNLVTRNIFVHKSDQEKTLKYKVVTRQPFPHDHTTNTNFKRRQTKRPFHAIESDTKLPFWLSRNSKFQTRKWDPVLSKPSLMELLSTFKPMFPRTPRSTSYRKLTRKTTKKIKITTVKKLKTRRTSPKIMIVTRKWSPTDFMQRYLKTKAAETKKPKDKSLSVHSILTLVTRGAFNHYHHKKTTSKFVYQFDH